MTSRLKSDQHAREHWGEVYDKIPKSVFATVCWHLANIASAEPDMDGAAEARFVNEIRILVLNEIMPKAQGTRAMNNALDGH